ncbi:MAG: hypothetical protein HY823_00735 [Acidobacteria bacterium]|nr:hypothetical protein [Acidobacteriota bacterium]
MTGPAKGRVAAAYAVALTVDALQIGLGALTGGLSMFVDKALDLVAAGLLWGLLGWHLALLPTFLVELLPIVELAPTWTAAVWFMTRKAKP